VSRFKAPVAALIPLALAACSTEGQLRETGVVVNRSACPAVAIPAATGDVTLFNPPGSRDAAAIDVVAEITNVRATCDETGANIVSNVTFDVLAQRRDARGARDVVLPYFAVAMQGGTNVVSKSVGRVGLHFDDGQLRASTRGSAAGTVSRAAVTLPEDVRQQITRERKPGDADAAIDPLADPKVREAVRAASFELLVGFQLTQEQLAYNATR
jgi:predicted kinase